MQRSNSNKRNSSMSRVANTQRNTSQPRITQTNFRPTVSKAPQTSSRPGPNLPKYQAPPKQQERQQQQQSKQMENSKQQENQQQVVNIQQVSVPQQNQRQVDEDIKEDVQQESFTPWESPQKEGNFHANMFSIDESDTFDLLKHRNYETLLQYDQTQKKEELKEMVISNNEKENQDTNKKQETKEEVKESKGKKYVKKLFSVNTGMCRSELELIQFIIQQNGFMETTSANVCNLTWYGLSLTNKDIETIQKNSFYFNRYPGLELLARKKLFCTVVNRMRKTFPSDIKFCPISFQLPEECNELEQYMKDHPKFTFIAKPSRGKGGEGIVLVQKFTDIPQQTWNFKQQEWLVQRYIKSPLLIDKKKFDLRIYVLIKSFDPIQAYVCEEGLARFCTTDYKKPTKENLKQLFMHLTNYSLNKNSENYKAPDDDFLSDDNGSKRLLSSLWKTLEEEGHDVDKIKSKIKDTVKKAVITLEPYLVHYHHQSINYDHSESKAFHLVGFDILLDTKLNAWLMEINANPSFNMFLERDLPNGEVEKTVSELDKYVKAKVIQETIRIVSGQGGNENEGLFEQVLPDANMDSYYVWNQAQELFEYVVGNGKSGDTITLYQFQKLSKVPEFTKTGNILKADFDIAYKNALRKNDQNQMDLYSFMDGIEMLCVKVYKSDLYDSISQFLENAIAYFESQQK